MKDAEYYYKRGLRNNLADYSAAFDDYSKAVAQNPSHIHAYLKRGTLSYKILKRYNEASIDFDKALELNPDCAEAYLHRGIVKCHLLKFAEALPDFDRAVELDPNDERAFFNRGNCVFLAVVGSQSAIGRGYLKPLVLRRCSHSVQHPHRDHGAQLRQAPLAYCHHMGSAPCPRRSADSPLSSRCPVRR